MFGVRDFHGLVVLRLRFWGFQLGVFGVSRWVVVILRSGFSRFWVSRWVVGISHSGYSMFGVSGSPFRGSGFRVRISGFLVSR